MNDLTNVNEGQAAVAAAYDAVPYDSQPFADSRPAYLGALGVLCGLQAASPSRCRVLELGCASGGNLIPLAWYHPHSEFIGIDLSPGQINVGRELVKALGISNCQLQAGDLSAIELEAESFDYVIAHGLYSWVPDSVRPTILALCRRVLRRGGIAYVSYNTLPGWRSRLLTRDLLQWHLRDVQQPDARLHGAQALVQRLANGLDPGSPGSYLGVELARIQSHPASYLAHEYLEADNRAFHFHEFVADAAAAGLGYLCNADLATGFAELYGAMGEAMAELCDDPVQLEQYLDFVANRAFRQSLLCRDDDCASELNFDRLQGVHLWTDLRPPHKLDLRRAKGQNFHTADGEQVEIYHPLCKALVEILAHDYPRTEAYPDLLDAAAEQVRQRGDARLAADRQGALGELFGLIIMQHLEPLSEPAVLAAEMSRYPRASALARCQAKLGWSHLATASHRSLDLDPFARTLIDRLDGSRDPAALGADMLEWLAQQQPLDAQARRRAAADVQNNVNRLLQLFARYGVLEGE